jgi:hypothetical protein
MARWQQQQQKEQQRNGIGRWQQQNGICCVDGDSWIVGKKMWKTKKQ